MFNMRTACDTAHVKSILWLFLNMLQHVLGNSLQCGGVSLLTTCLARKLNFKIFSAATKNCLKTRVCSYVCNYRKKSLLKQKTEKYKKFEKQLYINRRAKNKNNVRQNLY